mmetsp:Transcript_50794/g.101086  ORF Transcript_50794/g.101086 Transcript_50794/m.101086 type:complete len:238 (-) Transcript_50794:884-1597(-)
MRSTSVGMPSVCWISRYEVPTSRKLTTLICRTLGLTLGCIGALYFGRWQSGGWRVCRNNTCAEPRARTISTARLSTQSRRFSHSWSCRRSVRVTCRPHHVLSPTRAIPLSHVPLLEVVSPQASQARGRASGASPAPSTSSQPSAVSWHCLCIILAIRRFSSARRSACVRLGARRRRQQSAQLILKRKDGRRLRRLPANLYTCVSGMLQSVCRLVYVAPLPIDCVIAPQLRGRKSWAQ